MAKLKELTIRHGEVSYFAGVEATEDTTVTVGNVTTHNKGQPGSPEHFEVSFRLTCECDDGSIAYHNIFSLSALVHGLGRDASYSSIEHDAALKLAPMLRLIADEVENIIARQPSPSAIV